MWYKLLAFAAALAAASPAAAGWRQASTDHFVIYSEDSEKDLRDFATRLERFDQAMRKIRGVPDRALAPSNRLTVFVVRDLRAVQKLYGRGAQDVGGFYLGRATGSFAITPASTRRGGGEDAQALIILLHEYAHHFMMQNFPGAFPAWLIEGYAEFNSTAKFEKDGSVGIGLPAQHRAVGLFMGPELKIDTLLTANVGELKPEERDVLYGRGWLLTHYLTFDQARAGQLSAYLSAINKGTASLAAARSAFGDLETLDKDLRSYLRQKRMTYMKLGADKISIGDVAVRELTPAEAAVMDVRIRSKRGVDKEGAGALLPLARKAAAPFPDDVLAQTTLAEAEYDAGNYAEAEAAADRALAADPKAVEALIYKGRAQMARAEEKGESDPAAWKAVRKWFLAANKIEPEDPEPLILFYDSFLSAGENPTANASAGLQWALQLAPQDDGLRWKVAQQLLREDKPAEARAALAPVAYSPHGGEQTAAASLILAAIDEGGATAALAAWGRQAGSSAPATDEQGGDGPAGAGAD